jgi:sortase A
LSSDPPDRPDVSPRHAVESEPDGAAPTETLPTETLPSESLPTDPLPTDPIPDDSAPDEPATSDAGVNDPAEVTEAGEHGASAVGPARQRTTGDYVRAFVRGVGQTMVTLGLVVLLFVVYELWVTNIYAHAKQVKAKQTLTRVWKEHKDPLKGVDRAKLPAGKQVILPAGQGFANLYIPRLGKDYAYTIVQGTTEDDLARGPGHYEGSAIPGQIGNFAVAGHRVTHGQPFLNADQINAGDPIVVQTEGNWYVYRVLGNAKTGRLSAQNSQGVPGREIVDPTSVGVVAPVPDHPGERPSIAYMTMTTCNPKYSASQRMVIHSVLARSVKASGTNKPREIGGTL